MTDPPGCLEDQPVEEWDVILQSESVVSLVLAGDPRQFSETAGLLHLLITMANPRQAPSSPAERAVALLRSTPPNRSPSTRMRSGPGSPLPNSELPSGKGGPVVVRDTGGMPGNCCA